MKSKVANTRVIKGRYCMDFIFLIRLWKLLSREIIEANHVTEFEKRIGQACGGHE